MVNSKKMSKSSVAVIVLAILLVLSMVLGLTGAYFTADGSVGSSEGGSVTIRDGWLKLEVTGAAGSISGASENAMPGDVITVTDATFAIKATRLGEYTGAVSAHVFLVDGEGNEVDYVLVTIAQDADEAPVTFANLDSELDLTDDDGILVDNGNGTYTVNTALTYADAGKTASFAGINGYTIKAIQQENLDKAAAKTALGIN